MCGNTRKRINVRIRFIGSIADDVGGKEVSIQLDEAKNTMKDLIKRLDEIYDGRVSRIASHPHISVMLNGRDIDFLRGLETTISDGDSVIVVPPIAGG